MGGRMGNIVNMRYCNWIMICLKLNCDFNLRSHLNSACFISFVISIN